jgi:flavorubredoxin
MIKQEQIKEKPIKVQHLGPFVVDQTHAHNSYLILSDDADILVDVPPIQVFDLLKISLNKFIEINELTHMIIQQTHMSTANVIIELIDEGFKGKIITNQYFARQIRNLNLPIEILCIEDGQYRMNIGKTMFMGFIPMMFLPIPQMFMTYLPTFKRYYPQRYLAVFTPKRMLRLMRSRNHFSNTTA